MKTRCNNPKATHYKHYGGRGITFCDRWSEFSSFLEDMGERPTNTSLDRVDNNGNYEKDNCRWATPTEQAKDCSGNKHVLSKLTKDNVLNIRKMLFDGISQTAVAAKFKVSQKTISNIKLRKTWRHVE